MVTRLYLVLVGSISEAGSVLPEWPVPAPAEWHVIPGPGGRGSPTDARDPYLGPRSTDLGLAASTGAIGLAPPLRRPDA